MKSSKGGAVVRHEPEGTKIKKHLQNVRICLEEQDGFVSVRNCRAIRNNKSFR